MLRSPRTHCQAVFCSFIFSSLLPIRRSMYIPCYSSVLVISWLPRLSIITSSRDQNVWSFPSPHLRMPPRPANCIGSLTSLGLLCAGGDPRWSHDVCELQLVQMGSQACLGQMACAPLELDPSDAAQSSVPLPFLPSFSSSPTTSRLHNGTLQLPL